MGKGDAAAPAPSFGDDGTAFTTGDGPAGGGYGGGGGGSPAAAAADDGAASSALGGPGAGSAGDGAASSDSTAGGGGGGGGGEWGHDPSSVGPSPFGTEGGIVEAASDAAASSSGGGLPWDPTWYYLSDRAIELVNLVQASTGWTYAASICAITLAARSILLPAFISGQRNAARMAHMKPEMEAVQRRMEEMTAKGNVDMETRMRVKREMKAMMKKYDVRPLRSFLLPVVQIPLFVSMFFGLRKMPDYFPDELGAGGILWFTDLTVPDPYYALPVLSAVTMLAMVELGKEQMMSSSNPQQGEMFLNLFRVLSVAAVPVTMNFPASIFCFWITNNTVSMLQSAAFSSKALRRRLGIWDPPKPPPGEDPPKGFFESIRDAAKPSKAEMEAERIRSHNAAVDRLKGVEEEEEDMKPKAGRNRRGRGGRRGMDRARM